MATEYIDKEEACRIIRSYKCGQTAFDARLDFAINEIAVMPAADVRPVVHGRWIPMTYIRELTENGWPNCRWEKAIETDSVDGLMCSECSEIFDVADARNFCTQCGSDMHKVVEIEQVKEDE